MTVRGRPRTPTKLKLLAGNPGKRPLKLNEPDAGDLPPCPEYLKGIGEETYRWIEATIGNAGCRIMRASDAKLAELIAMQWAMVREANEKLAITGPVLVHTDKDGVRTMRISPYLHVRNGATDRLRVLLSECGLTPSSRTKFATDQPQEISDEEQFFARSG